MKEKSNQVKSSSLLSQCQRKHVTITYAIYVFFSRQRGAGLIFTFLHMPLLDLLSYTRMSWFSHQFTGDLIQSSPNTDCYNQFMCLQCSSCDHLRMNFKQTVSYHIVNIQFMITEVCLLRKSTNSLSSSHLQEVWGCSSGSSETPGYPHTKF